MKYLIYAIIYFIFWIINIYTQIFIFKESSNEETLKTINVLLWTISIVLPIFIGICLFIHIKKIKFQYQMEEFIFFLPFLLFLPSLYLVLSLNVAKLNKDSFEHKFLSIYSILSLFLILVCTSLNEIISNFKIVW